MEIPILHQSNIAHNMGCSWPPRLAKARALCKGGPARSCPGSLRGVGDPMPHQGLRPICRIRGLHLCPCMYINVCIYIHISYLYTDKVIHMYIYICTYIYMYIYMNKNTSIQVPDYIVFVTITPGLICAILHCKSEQLRWSSVL